MMKYSEMYKELNPRFRIVKLSKDTLLICRKCAERINIPHPEYEHAIYMAGKHEEKHSTGPNPLEGFY